MVAVLVSLAACSNSGSSSNGSGGNFNRLEKITPELTQKFKDFSYKNTSLGLFVADSISYSRFSANAPKEMTDNCSVNFTYGEPTETATGISSSVINVAGSACPLEIKFERGTIPNTRSERMKWNSTYSIISSTYQERFGIRQVDDTYEVAFSSLPQDLKIYSRLSAQKYFMTDGSQFEITLSVQKNDMGDTQELRFASQINHNGNVLRYSHDWSLNQSGNLIPGSSLVKCEFNDKDENFSTCQEGGVLYLRDIGAFTSSYRINY